MNPKKIFSYMLYIVILITAGCQSPTSSAPVPAELTPATPSTTLETAALDFVNLLAEGKYDQAVSQFDPTMLEVLPAQKLEETTEQIKAGYGDPLDPVKFTSTEESGYQIVYVTYAFQKGMLDIKIVFDDTGKIAGLYFTKPNSANAASYRSPSYSNTDQFSDREVTVGSGDWELPGTLSIPDGKGPFPAVILVHGSGPNDQDETIGPNKPFRDLAEGLASRGIAVLRFEKRTKQYPEELMAEFPQMTVQEESIDDALAAIQLLQDTPEIDAEQIYILGHSLGGMLAPRIAEQSNDLAGLIILAGAARPLEDLLIEQYNYLLNLDGTVTPQEDEQMAQIQAMVAQIKDPNLSIESTSGSLIGAPAAYWLDLREYNPAQTAAHLDLPMLILQGERDYQVTEQDFLKWKQALDGRDNALFKEYPTLNHLFIPGTGQSTPAEYELAGHVSRDVIEDIESFITTGNIKMDAGAFGLSLDPNEITRLVLLILPIFLLQIGVSIYALVDLSRRQKTRGARWMWAVFLVVSMFGVPSGFVVSAVYLIWARKEDDYGDDDQS